MLAMPCAALIWALLIPPQVLALSWHQLQFPDLRGATVSQCVRAMPHGQLLYICDPDNILNTSQGNGATESMHGWVVSIAIVNNIQMTVHSPSDAQLTERAEIFTKALEGRWALGDCGNSVIIFVWEHYKKIIIWPARLAEKYLTYDERKAMLANVNDLVQTDQWFDALAQLVDSISKELSGEPEVKVDTGTLALIISVAVAVLLTMLITCCVCAFRCCGNLKSDERPRGVLAAAHRVDSIRALVMRRGSQLRRSFSKSPKFPLSRDAPDRFFADTTMV